MKKSYKTMLGVTLLEIMLVLAIAGIIIAMSVRYYQQAATNQKVTAGVSAVTAVVAAVEQWKLKGTPVESLKDGDLDNYFPQGTNPVSPWDNAALTYAGVSGSSTYEVTISVPDSGGCKILAEQLGSQPGYKANCSGNEVVTTVGATGA